MWLRVDKATRNREGIDTDLRGQPDQTTRHFPACGGGDDKHRVVEHRGHRGEDRFTADTGGESSVDCRPPGHRLATLRRYRIDQLTWLAGTRRCAWDGGTLGLDSSARRTGSVPRRSDRSNHNDVIAPLTDLGAVSSERDLLAPPTPFDIGSGGQNGTIPCNR